MKIWVDVDNAPHVMVVTPLIRELRARGHEVEITARDYGQTIPLLKLRGLEYTQIGRHSGRNKLGKCLAFLRRSSALLRYGRSRHFDAIVCHVSRGVFLPARILRIPLVVLSDYEHSTLPAFMARWAACWLVPDVMPVDIVASRGIERSRITGYPGLKEDLYIHELRPDPTPMRELGIDPNRPVVLVRPPATMAHYYVRASGVVFREVLAFLSSHREVQVVLLPRTDEQRREILRLVEALGCHDFRVPDKVYDGPGLVWFSDLVISGGGTMNREAATLNVPVYSIYQGPLGAVDRHLVSVGRLRLLTDSTQFTGLPLRKSSIKRRRTDQDLQRRVLDFVVEHILAAARGSSAASVAP